MPRGSWSRKDERQYKHIYKSCMRYKHHGRKVCKRIAAATVNKFRSKKRRRR